MALPDCVVPYGGASITLAPPGATYLKYQDALRVREVRCRRELGTDPGASLPFAAALAASREATVDAGCIEDIAGWSLGTVPLAARKADGSIHRANVLRLLVLPPVWRRVATRLQELAQVSEERIQAGQDMLVRLVEWDTTYGPDLESYRERVEETRRIADRHRERLAAADSAQAVRGVVENLGPEALAELAAEQARGADASALRDLAARRIAEWEEHRYPKALRIKPECRDPFLLDVYRAFWALHGDRETIIVPMGGAIPGPPRYTARGILFLARGIPAEDQPLYERYWNAMEAKVRDLQPKGGKG